MSRSNVSNRSSVTEAIADNLIPLPAETKAQEPPRLQPATVITQRPVEPHTSAEANRELIELMRPLARVLLIQARRQLAAEARARIERKEKAA